MLTDAIAGFPGETEEDFLGTMRLIEETRPDAVNVSKFGPRPGTAAALMEQLPGGVIKERSERLSALARGLSLESHRRLLGWEGDALITERGRKAGQFSGRTPSYKTVIVESREDITGTKVRVRAKRAGTACLRCELA